MSPVRSEKLSQQQQRTKPSTRNKAPTLTHEQRTVAQTAATAENETVNPVEYETVNPVEYETVNPVNIVS